MEIGSKGIFLMIWGKKEYGYAAANFAMSLKYYCPLLPIHLLTDRSAVNGVLERSMQFFDSIEYMDETPHDPALTKIQVYDRLPFEHNLYLDVDALCMGDLSASFDKLIEENKPFRCAVHEWYDKDSPNDLPQMFWAKKDTIWNHYGFTDEKLPATQSSLQYIKKCEFTKNLYGRTMANYANRIPTDQLKNKWGGGQPDELYLNITLAQIGYDPSFTGIIYFANDNSISFTQVKVNHQILSMFGPIGMVKPQFVSAYDNTLSNITRQLGGKATEWKYISGGKIANVRSSPNDGMRRGAFQKRFFKQEKFAPVEFNASVNLLVSYYDANTPERQKEIDYCMDHNCNNPQFTTIYNLGKPYSHPKVINLNYDRPTYQDFINEANKAGGNYTVIANSDIYFDTTINWIHQVDMTGHLIALCRYDVDSVWRYKLFPYAHSQDVWIFKGKIKIDTCDYVLGVPGCDNRFAYDAMMHGYKVVNPAKDILTFHLHNSSERNYTEANRLHGGYKPVYIGSIRDIKPKTVLIIQPGKVGDILICFPIAKYYSDKGFSVYWVAPKEYHSMFTYVDYVTVVGNVVPADKVIDLSFGINRNSKHHQNWIKRRPSLDSFCDLKFEIAEVPMNEYRNLVYNRNTDRENELYKKVVAQNDSYKLVHRLSDYGAHIDVGGNCIYFDKVEDYTIFDWRKVIENATEIHCIDSSLLNFVDSIETTAKLFYHITDKVPLKADRARIVKNWQIINVLEI